MLAGWALVGTCGGRVLAQESDTTEINKTRLYLLGGALTGTVVGIHLYQQAAWWQGDRAPFRFENDWQYALNIDKWGHTYGAYVAANVAQSALRWSNVPKQNSLVYGCLLGLSYQLYVELEDGYHRSYGFSPGDAFSDVIGASIPLAQAAFPVLQNFSMQWSYYPSSEYIDALEKKQFKVFIDDYEGQIYWIRMDPHFLLDRKTAQDFPKWLGVSFGIAAHNLNGSGVGDRTFYLAADYRLSDMDICKGSDFVHALLSTLDYIHLPSPGIAWEDGKVKVGIFYTYHVKLVL